MVSGGVCYDLRRHPEGPWADVYFGYRTSVNIPSTIDIIAVSRIRMDWDTLWNAGGCTWEEWVPPKPELEAFWADALHKHKLPSLGNTGRLT